MVNSEATNQASDAELDLIFGALSDSTRRRMLFRLAQGPATVGELGAPFGITKGAVTKHVKVLERSGLLRRDVQGRVHQCDIDPEFLARAQRWVEFVRGYWDNRFDALADYLEEMKASDAHPSRKEP